MKNYDIFKNISKMPPKDGYRPFCKFANHLKKVKNQTSKYQKVYETKKWRLLRLNVQNFLYFTKITKYKNLPKSCIS